MSKRTEFNDALKTAMKGGDQVAVGTIRLINAGLKQKDIDARPSGKEVTDANILSMLQGRISGATAAWQYGRMKAGKHPKFAAHALYWWFPSGLFLKLRATPPSDQRYFLG